MYGQPSLRQPLTKGPNPITDTTLSWVNISAKWSKALRLAPLATYTIKQLYRALQTNLNAFTIQPTDLKPAGVKPPRKSGRGQSWCTGLVQKLSALHVPTATKG
jgi:hypothetical protein